MTGEANVPHLSLFLRALERLDDAAGREMALRVVVVRALVDLWQIHAFGHVAHGFTNPKASEIGIEGVRYNALAAERSWTSFINLLEELFAGHG